MTTTTNTPVFRPGAVARSQQPKRMAWDPTAWADYLAAGRRDCETVSNATQAVADASKDSIKTARTWCEELFGSLYEDAPRVEGGAATPGPYQVATDALEQLPEFAELKDAVRGDADFAALAAADFAQAMAEKLAAIKDRIDQERAGTADPRLGTSQDLAMGAARAAVKEAADLNRASRVAVSGIAPGLSGAPTVDGAPDTARLELAEALRRDPFLAEIIRRAGKLRRQAGGEVRQVEGRGEVVGIERGGDVARLLPSALGGLADPDMELLALLDVVQSTALQYRLVGREQVGRGPVVVLLDKSGSMEGAPLQLACATALATLITCAREGRSATLVAFDGEAEVVGRINGDKDGRALAVLVGAISRIVAMGGTSLNDAMAVGVQEIGLEPRADLVLITDGDTHGVAPWLLDKLSEARTDHGTRVFGVVINGGRITGPVRDLCDELVNLDCDDPDKVAASLAARVSA